MNDEMSPGTSPDNDPTASGTSPESDAAQSGPEQNGAAQSGPEQNGLPARPGRARRLVLTALPFVLVLGAVGGAAAYTKSTVDGADRTVTTSVWAKTGDKPAEDPAGGPDRGRATTALSKLLLPVPKGYRLGPDIGEFGNDSETSGKKATAAMKEMGRGLAGKQRRELDKRIDRLRIQGIAQRSYTSDANDLTVEIHISKMRDRKAVHDTYAGQKELMDSFGGFRKGPRIEGHKKATCYRMPKDGKDKLDGVFCLAYDGEAYVSVTASGSEPFSTSDVADLVKDQLDHIKSPGEYV
ncbi:hypothetical protein [Streptomyces sp. NBC_01237]|uniref:hypothetical protein n=1 Tax=Streptomyces sp. NBC_01237 TaxID=2903790 RepID=UPI002DD7DF49|nr:hypothetical protein [Streptomyces sp. NBC_01237]WRZ74045.1 hypothetical protein OG251_21820 [Streptomyces sp. NBC_01237]